MVKHLSITKDITGTNLERFEAWLRQPEVYFEFHKSFNDNESITATPWKLAGREYTREVVAHLPVKAPAWFRKAIGTDTVRVKEFQNVSFEHSSSAPAPVYGPDMDPRDMTALHFTTQLCFFPPWKEVIPFVSVQLKYTNHPSRSNIVKVDVSLSCTAEGLPWLWVLHGAIEKTMLSQAKANISALIDFFQTEVDSGALTKKPQPVVQRAKIADVEEREHRGLSPAGSLGACPDSPRSVYFDAEEGMAGTDDIVSDQGAEPQAPKPKKRSAARRLLCCFSPCCKPEGEAGGVAPSQTLFQHSRYSERQRSLRFLLDGVSGLFNPFAASA